HQNELFMMHDDENISDMFTRFNTIINSLKNLGKNYSNQELVRKILRCLPKSWTPKMTAIEEAKDLTTLPLEQLIGTCKKNPQKEESSKKDKVICYECNKPRHYKNECPKLKKNKEHFKKKKVMIATWSDSDYSSSHEEEVANVAFMAIEKEEEDEVQFTYSFDELQNAYEKSFYEYENVSLKNITLKKDMLSKENE
ncbi:LOW QUALITY PROTEIN: zf-CCHC domain-containing protein/UBN2 domain-containing protein, partial [Cephalotus follicularis]